MKSSPCLTLRTYLESWTQAFIKWAENQGGKNFFETFHPSHSQSEHSFSVTLAFHWSTCFASSSALPVNYGYKPLVRSWSKRWKVTSTGKEHVDQSKSSHTERGRVQTGTATWQSWRHPLEVKPSQAYPLAQQCHA